MLKILCDTMQVDAERRAQRETGGRGKGGGGGVSRRGSRVGGGEGSEFQHVISEIEF